MRRSLAAAALFVVLAGCPGPPDEVGPPPDDGTGGGETPPVAEAVRWPDGPVTELARRETREALDALDATLRPLAFLVRLDVAWAGEDGAAPGWTRFGVLLSEDGLAVFDARPIDVTREGHGEPAGAHPLGALAAALGGLPLLDESGCGALGGEATCRPLLALVAGATPPAELAGEGRPVRVAAGDRAVLAEGADGTPVVVDLTVEDAPRVSQIIGSEGETTGDAEAEPGGSPPAR